MCTDVEREDFAAPALVQFFFLRGRTGTGERALHAQLEQVYGADRFTLEQLDDLPTFEEVRSPARHALLNYP